MFPQNSEKITVTDFGGLYRRGLHDEVPKDHFWEFLNVSSDRKGQISTRAGFNPTINIGATVLRVAASSINGVTTPITLVLGGFINAGSTPVQIYSNSAITDIVVLNMFNKTFILPRGPASANLPLLVWTGSGSARPALGFAPTSSFAAAATGTGNITIGTHKFAVSFVTNTGFTTQPGPKISYTFTPVVFAAPGGTQVILTGIPTGPAGTIARQIFATKANLDTYYYVDNGYIGDNTTTSVTLNFYDTDLAVDISDDPNDLFNNTEVITGGPTSYLVSYHGRMIVIGSPTEYQNGSYVAVNPDLVLVSNSGDAETFDNVTGFIQIPSQNDTNKTAGAIEVQDNIYFTKSVAGIYAVTDNFSVPSSWSIMPIDFSVGGNGYGIASVSSNAPSAQILNVALICDRTGLYAFNGNVQFPALSYNIEDIWLTLFESGSPPSTQNIAVDTQNQLIFISLTGYPYILVADYSDGLNAESIRWARWTLGPTNVGPLTLTYGDLGDGIRCLRVVIGPNSFYPSFAYNIYRYWVADNLTADNGTYPIQTQITSQEFYFEEGQVNLFTGVRIRALANVTSPVTLTLGLQSQDDGTTVTPPAYIVNSAPMQDYLRQINFTNEKMSITLSCTESGGGITLSRFDIFGKAMWPSRPQ